MSPELKFDEIGYWSEVKLAILEEYAKPYNQIIHAQATKLQSIYVDGFAGAGHHYAKGWDRIVEKPYSRRTVQQYVFNVRFPSSLSACLSTHPPADD